MASFSQLLFEDSFISFELSCDVQGLIASSVFESLLSETAVLDVLQDLDESVDVGVGPFDSPDEV